MSDNYDECPSASESETIYMSSPYYSDTEYEEKEIVEWENWMLNSYNQEQAFEYLKNLNNKTV